jgi:ABC-2 type transport system ATP-binding protein
MQVTKKSVRCLHIFLTQYSHVMFNKNSQNNIMLLEKNLEGKKVIEVKNLTKLYGNNVAVDDLSFTVEPGKIYGLLGANGAGKSTTMNIMTGYIGATAGTVVIDGHDIFEEPEAAKKKIGYLPEIPPLYLDMTVKEYLTFAAALKQLPKAERKDDVEEAMEMTRVKAVENRLISKLSKGYKQRVGLAYAILGMPEIIILDEPTVGLDPAQIIEIRDLIQKLGEEHTVILSSHILSEVRAVCQHIFIISNGKLVASDTPENLVKLGNTKNTIHLEVKASREEIEPVLEALTDVQESRILSEKEGILTLELDTVSEVDIREAVFYALAEAKLPILSMNMESKSLEEIFMELTAGETQKRGRQKPKRHKKEEAAEAGNDEEEAAEAGLDEEAEVNEETDAGIETADEAAGEAAKALPEKAELKEDEVNDSDI